MKAGGTITLGVKRFTSACSHMGGYKMVQTWPKVEYKPKSATFQFQAAQCWGPLCWRDLPGGAIGLYKLVGTMSHVLRFGCRNAWPLSCMQMLAMLLRKRSRPNLPGANPSLSNQHALSLFNLQLFRKKLHRNHTQIPWIKVAGEFYKQTIRNQETCSGWRPSCCCRWSALPLRLPRCW